MTMSTLYEKFLKWINEDCPFGDITTEALIPEDTWVKAVVLAKSYAITACVEDVINVLKRLGIEVLNYVKSGTEVRPGDIVMELKGRARSILTIERTLLNLLIHLFGIATTTRKIVEMVRKVNPKVRIAATRKTIPGIGYLAKKAVMYGGGDTHRFSLSDAVIIKDNHLKIIGDVERAVKAVKSRISFIHKVEVEVSNVEDAIKAAKAGADIIMLDNMKVEDVKKVLEELKRLGLRERVIVEVSGGITPNNILDYARLDIDVISLSAITINPERVDLSLEIIEVL